MTESEYLASEDPRALLAHLRARVRDPEVREGVPYQDPLVGPRKLRLFATGCCRLVWPLLTDSRSRNAVGVAERYANGLATRDEVHVAMPGISFAPAYVCLWPDMHEAVTFFLRRCRMARIHGWQHMPSPAAQAALLREVVGNPFRPTLTHKDLARHGVLDWNGNTVPRLARAAYEQGRGEKCRPCGGSGRRQVHRRSTESAECGDCGGTGRTGDGLLDHGRLAVLADALEEAGCDEESLLRHLRGRETHRASCFVCQHYAEGDLCPHCIKGVYVENEDGDQLRCDACRGTGLILSQDPHARGCWPLDLVLGKE
jgi:hypothetical protein